MKKSILFCVFTMVTIIAFAQTITVTGTVNDQQGKPVPFAFINDVKHSYATYSNTEGIYNIQADPSSKLAATAINFQDASIDINNKTNINIVLTAGTSASAGKGLGKASNNSFFNTQTAPVLSTLGSQYLKGGQQEVHGSRYLYDQWQHGYAVSAQDSLIQNNEYLFNYDKVSGELLFTRDQSAVYLGDKSQVKQFVIFDDKGQSVTYEHVIPINARQYVQVLASGKNYKIYKQGSTKFEKANYTTNGITSSGVNYDEYVDQYNYFVVKNGAQPVKIALKKKALKEAFAADADKFNKFASAQQGDIDDNYLKDLGDAMNQ